MFSESLSGTSISILGFSTCDSGIGICLGRGFSTLDLTGFFSSSTTGAGIFFSSTSTGISRSVSLVISSSNTGSFSYEPTSTVGGTSIIEFADFTSGTTSSALAAAFMSLRLVGLTFFSFLYPTRSLSFER